MTAEFDHSPRLGAPRNCGGGFLCRKTGGLLVVANDRIRRSWLNPYTSLLFLQCARTEPTNAVEHVLRLVRERLSRSRSGEVTVVASGVGGISEQELQE